MIYFLSFIIVLGVPVFLHELGHFLAAKSVGIRVEKFYVGFDFFNLGFKKKYRGTEYGIGLFPMGGYVKVSGILDENMDMDSDGKPYEFRSKNVFQKVWFLSAGVIMNFILAIIIFTSFTFFQGSKIALESPIINEVAINSPADKIGLQTNDEILYVNNSKIDTFNDLRNIIEPNFNRELTIIWNRNDITYNAKIIPEEQTIFKTEKGFYPVGIIGVSAYYEEVEKDFLSSLYDGLNQTQHWIYMFAYSLSSVVTGEVSFNQLAGPIGIGKIAGDTAQSGGILALIYLMALISINLGIINILPLPVVDGGHVVIAIIEGVMQREIPLKIKYYIQITGSIFLMSLFIFVFANDIYRLIFLP